VLLVKQTFRPTNHLLHRKSNTSLYGSVNCIKDIIPESGGVPDGPFFRRIQVFEFISILYLGGMKMITLFLSLFVGAISYAQAPDWQWAIKQMSGGGSADAAESVATDAEGNVYMTGSFQSESLTFGSITLDNINAPNQDLFLAKFNSAGVVVWAIRAGGTQADYGLSLAIDPSGNIYLGGYFKSTSITFGGITLSNPGVPFGDPFLAKFDKDGNVIWAKKSSNALSSDALLSVATDASGDVYATGHFISDQITFGGITLTNPGNGTQELFIVKYSSTGTVLWADRIGGTGDEVGNAVVVDGQGNVFMAGQFSSSSVSVGSTTLTNINSPNVDLFLAKYNPSGGVIWANRAGGLDSDYLLSLSVDDDGNVFGSGYLKSTSISFGAITLFNDGDPFGDSFLAKFDTDGQCVWAQSASNSVSSDAATSITTDPLGNVYITGHFLSDVISFGATTLTNVAAPAQDIYIAKYDGNGNPIWAASIGGDKNDVGNAITCDAVGNLYLAGIFQSNEITFTSTTLSNSGFSTNDLFLSKIGTTVSTTGEMQENNLIVYPNPYSDYFIVELDQEVPQMTLTLTNQAGQIVFRTQKSPGTRCRIDRNNIPAGVYFLSVTTGTRTVAIEKVVLVD
jgi:hypothetical protein